MRKDYEATKHDELSLKSGDILQLLGKFEEDRFFYGYFEDRLGYFPFDCTQEVQGSLPFIILYTGPVIMPLFRFTQTHKLYTCDPHCETKHPILVTGCCWYLLFSIY